MQIKAEEAEFQELIQMIQHLPPADLAVVRRIVEAIAYQSPASRKFEYDDEELSEEGKLMLVEGRNSLANDPLTDHEDFRRELGLFLQPLSDMRDLEPAT